MIKGTVITAWKGVGEPATEDEMEKVIRPNFKEDYPKSAFDEM